MPTLSAILDELTVPGELCESVSPGVLRCLACAHRCVLAPGKRGACRVRFNHAGELRVPWGYVAALQADPVEKKPFWHVLPGATALTFGMLGCDLHCAYCQNWLTSQALRDPACDVAGNLIRRVTPEELVKSARRVGARLMVASYNEPLITAEWAAAIFQQAKSAGLKCGMVSNGHATPEALRFLRPWLDAYKVDLKSMRQETYRQLGGSLKNVLAAIETALTLGLWVEVVTLVVPGLNDSNEELWQAARFLRGLSANIPWHVTAFHPDYTLTDRGATPAETLIRAAEIGREAGLNFVYAGNLPGQVGEYEETRCPACGCSLIKRRHFTVTENRLGAGGICPQCQTKLPGVWS
ncbi:MAG: AmmeMemoRadiSam system radical SAM enzyme [Anaerolineae bacterium CG_4_9_14_3_um_filter_57_17]|nr:AmmeMemoRadiSam system radical SAM enzyme [bacterium]NCT19825.1 AmmeMemoRadiSam system radical SAM enzyme [bacterium]OIO84974.1 MAG: AmmeMemoRadiSam system radical SAM enzyme [Anaerolineae bacterium CG2_30_57_67]PJB64634.1 MAG: AmmeMemoRadiSam system radical SAM enzyme [Anaerolineae bacterium CG_4_9_14_3_um_filter_57_17]